MFNEFCHNGKAINALIRCNIDHDNLPDIEDISVVKDKLPLTERNKKVYKFEIKLS